MGTNDLVIVFQLFLCSGSRLVAMSVFQTVVLFPVCTICNWVLWSKHLVVLNSSRCIGIIWRGLDSSKATILQEGTGSTAVSGSPPLTPLGSTCSMSISLGSLPSAIMSAQTSSSLVPEMPLSSSLFGSISCDELAILVSKRCQTHGLRDRTRWKCVTGGSMS